MDIYRYLALKLLIDKLAIMKVIKIPWIVTFRPITQFESLFSLLIQSLE